MKTVMTKLKQAFTTNIVLKIAAIFIAAIIWLAVVNLSDPTKTITIYGVQIQITDEDAITTQDKVYSIEGSTTTNVTVTGKRSVLSDLNASDFVAKASLNDLSVVNSIQVDVNAVAGLHGAVSIVNQSVRSISVNVEDLIRKEYSISTDVVGTVASGCYLQDITLSNNRITVIAPKSVQERIAEATITVDVSNVDSSYSNKYKVRLYDKNGNKIKSDYIEKSFSKVNVKATVLKGENVEVTVEYSGVPADGYVVTDVTHVPLGIIVVKTGNTDSTIDKIEIPKEAVSVQDAKEDVEAHIDLKDYIPKGYSIPSGVESEIVVTVGVEKIATQTYTIEADNISLKNIESGMSAQILSGEMTVEISGLQADLDEIEADDIKATIDLKGQKEETKSYTADINLPDKVTLESVSSVRVKITNKK